MIGSRVYSARVPLLLAFVKHIVRRAQPRNESVFRCGDTTVRLENCTTRQFGSVRPTALVVIDDKLAVADGP